MDDGKIKEMWKEIYSIDEWLGLERKDLYRLIEELIGKKAETEKEIKEVLEFLRAVKKKLENKFLTLEEAINEVKAESEIEKNNSEKWDRTVEIGADKFIFKLESDDRLICKNIKTNDNYIINPLKPECNCPDFQINKKRQEWCKHLKAASVAGYEITKLPEMPEEIKDLAKSKKEKTRKAKREEIVTINVLDKQVQVPVIQTPDKIIHNEDAAAKMLRDILGEDVKYEDVIERYGNIEEIKADVICSLAQYAGIRFVPINKETESMKINLGKLYLLSEMDEKKRQTYAEIADIMPDTDVVMRCKVTAVAAWKDQIGAIRIGVATKEEHLTPFDLKDICRRGSNFIETRAESKAYKKAILVSLPITHDGLKSKIKKLYHWMEK